MRVLQYKANPINQIRGMRNNAQGHIFEDAVKKGCRIYQRDGRAIIDKTPEPFRVLKKEPGWSLYRSVYCLGAA